MNRGIENKKKCKANIDTMKHEGIKNKKELEKISKAKNNCR